MRAFLTVCLFCLAFLPSALALPVSAHAADAGRLEDSQGKTTGTYSRQGNSVIIRDRQGRTLGRMEQTPQGDLRATDRQGRRTSPGQVLPQ